MDGAHRPGVRLRAGDGDQPGWVGHGFLSGRRISKPVQDFVLKALAGEDIVFKAVHIELVPSAKDNAPTRKPNTGMLTAYMHNPAYDLEHSFVIGDRITDVQLAKNLGLQGDLAEQRPFSLAPAGGNQHGCRAELR